MANEFLFRQIVFILHAPVYICSETGELYNVYKYEYGNIENNIDFTSILERAAGRSPYIEISKNGTAVCLMYNALEKKYVLFGETFIYDYCKREESGYGYCSKEEYTSAVLIMWREISGKELGRYELWQISIGHDDMASKILTEDIFKFQEESVSFNLYPHELKEQDSIRRGDIETLKECINEVYLFNNGKLASDPIRNSKNIAVYIISAAARSAIEGGVSPEMALMMASSFIKNIEDNLDDPVRIESAARDAQLVFAKDVHNIKSKGSSLLMMNVKDYVFEHVHDMILIRDIARHVGVSPNYLSEQFKVQEGVTLKQYIIDEKIKSSEYLLKYTEYSLQEISSYFAFSSQSRYSVYFQRKNGITPAKYRKRFQKG